MPKQPNRKDEHVELAESQYQERANNDFEAVRFVHHSLPQVAMEQVDLSTEFASLPLSSPFYINGMTGGSEKTKKINHDLAIVARETNLLMASGSLSPVLKDATTQDSFTTIRKQNPHGFVLANLGPDHSLENAKRVVDLLQADALQIHVNAPQELVMPEGDRDFSNWLSSIRALTEQLDVPVIVKEVGFGMSRETLQLLREIGVKTVDISGRGGTNFVTIENARRTTGNYDFLRDWGQSTAISLLESTPYQANLEILASGGIKNSLDMAKALALGARACGLSGQFLHLIVNEGIEATIEAVRNWQTELTTIMTLLGVTTIAELQTTDLILYGPLREWCQARQIDFEAFAMRSTQRIG